MTIFKDMISDHLTEAPSDRAARATHPGQAHFAGSGPHGRACRECISWKHEKYDYLSKNGKYRGLIKPAMCLKFKSLTRQEGPKIPDDAAACRYFEENSSIPARYAKG